MMTDLLLIALSSFAISSLLLYGVWAKLRVVFLRQSLFEIRDELWDQARSHDCFDDVAYQRARQHLNVMIDFCSLYSFRSLLRIAEVSKTFEVRPQVRSSNAALQSAIEAAYAAATDEVMSFILLKRVSGLRVLLTMGCSAFLHSSITTLRQMIGRMRAVLSTSILEVLEQAKKSVAQ